MQHQKEGREVWQLQPTASPPQSFPPLSLTLLTLALTPRFTYHNEYGREDLDFGMLRKPSTSSSLLPLFLPLPSLVSIEFLLATPSPMPEVYPCKVFLWRSSSVGLANQLGTYLPDLAAASTKLRVLLSKNVSWVWKPEHEEEFNALKHLLTSATILKHFNPMLRSVILTYGSAAGIGFTLIKYGTDAPKAHLLRLQKPQPRHRSDMPQWSWKRLELSLPSKCAPFTCWSPPTTTFTLITNHQPLIGFF